LNLTLSKSLWNLIHKKIGFFQVPFFFFLFYEDVWIIICISKLQLKDSGKYSLALNTDAFLYLQLGGIV